MQRAISCSLVSCPAIEKGWTRSVCLCECFPIQLLLGDWLHTGLPVRCVTDCSCSSRAFSPLHSLNFLWLDQQVFPPFFFLFCPSCCWGCWWASPGYSAGSGKHNPFHEQIKSHLLTFPFPNNISSKQRNLPIILLTNWGLLDAGK